MKKQSIGWVNKGGFKMALAPVKGQYHLQNYKKTYQQFDWREETEFINGEKPINLTFHAIDRHIEEGYGEKPALHYVKDNQTITKTFHEVKFEIDRYVEVLRTEGVKQGDRVFVFLPKEPACYIAILAVIRIGAIACPLFEGFMTEAIHARIIDASGQVLITNKALAKRIHLNQLPSLQLTIYTEEVETRVLTGDNYVEWVTPETPMLIHYTSGSTGKPKGVVHAHRSFVHHLVTGKWVLDLHDDDIYWCTSHPGWVTGSVYGIFSPWLNRATVVIVDGRYDAKRWYRVLEDLKVTVFYSAPTAFRMLKSEQDLHLNYDLSHLRHVLSVGEPLNPEVIDWAYRAWGKRIHDTWWMTETGGHLVVNLPSQPIKPGSMGRPLPGIKVKVIDEAGLEVAPGTVGQLAVVAPWPGLMHAIWQDETKYQSYFNQTGDYLSGDYCYQDEDGYIFFTGRKDDLINTQGERVGPFEVESTLLKHEAIKEAAVIGKPDPLRGEIVKAFVTLNRSFTPTEALHQSLIQFVRAQLAPHAAPKEIEYLAELPKTKISGKILRRELREIDAASLTS